MTRTQTPLTSAEILTEGVLIILYVIQGKPWFLDTEIKILPSSAFNTK
jgi:hypothetical protein